MDKKSFFKSCTMPTQTYMLPDGSEVTLSGLTVGQRQKWLEAYEESPARGPVMLAILGCPLLDESDEEAVTNLPTTVVDEMATIVMDLSGMGEKKDLPQSSDSSTD